MGIELTTEDLARAEACIPRPKPRKAGITPGKVVFWGWHYPKMVLREGIGLHLSSWRGKSEMERAVRALAAPQAGESNLPALDVRMLTGRRHASLTAVALYSLARASGRELAPVIHDDGSLEPEDAELLKRLFPRVRLVSPDESLAALDEKLPKAKYPFLRQLRLAYIHLRKLTDLHVYEAGWKTVMDADVFFYRNPEQLLRCIDERRPYHMVDCQTSYGCPVATLDELAGASVHPRVNVGLLHLDSNSLDWDELEHASQVILARHGFSYYLEQALLAVVMGKLGAEPLDAGEYLVHPSQGQVVCPMQVAHHFVDRSSLLLFSHGWKSALRDGGAKVPGSVAPRC
jgi:hypothetical protein